MQKRWAFSMFFVMVFVAVMMVGAGVDRGSERFSMDGGKRGTVEFPHHMHQDALADCGACHDLFPKSPGAIQEMKSSGSLKKKQVMNSKCISCHKRLKKEKEASGPVKCGQCHTRT
jgi:hypothetical protein